MKSGGEGSKEPAVLNSEKGGTRSLFDPGDKVPMSWFRSTGVKSCSFGCRGSYDISSDAKRHVTISSPPPDGSPHLFLFTLEDAVSGSGEVTFAPELMLHYAGRPGFTIAITQTKPLKLYGYEPKIKADLWT